MCTVSIVPTDTGFRVLHSRDEQRTRAPELPPQWRTLDRGMRACWPLDPDAGGTWVGVREDGMFLGILNLNLRDEELDADRPDPTVSRGLVIPRLMESASLDAAVDDLPNIGLTGMKPFRLMLAATDSDGSPRMAVARFDATELTWPEPLGPLSGPMCLVSSGLGDDLVQCRLPLFEQLVVSDPSHENQRSFHRHQWGDRPEYSVLVSREHARTSSVTTVAVDHGKTPTVQYDPFAQDDPATDPIGAAMLQ